MVELLQTDLVSGDIGLSRNDKWLSKTIRWFESKWTGGANFSHAFTLVDERLLVEALDKIRINPLKKYSNATIQIWRIPISDVEREDLSLGLIRRVNGAYGYLKYPGFVLDALCSTVKRMFGKKEPVFFFSRTLGFSNIPVCSQLTVWAVHKFTSYRFKDKEGKGVNWREVNPDRLEDLLKLKINGAKIIFSS